MRGVLHLLCCWVVCLQVYGDGQAVFTVAPPIFQYYAFDSWVDHILVTRGGKLLTVDIHREEMRMASLERPQVAEDTLSLDAYYVAMVEMRDGRIALSRILKKEIVIIDTTNNTLHISKRINIQEDYVAIAEGPGDDTFIVGKGRDWHSNASIDVIDMYGRVQRTICNDTDVIGFPANMKRVGNSLFVSDNENGNLFRVDVNSGDVVMLLGNQFLRFPTDLDIAEDGTAYLITGGSVCQSERCAIRVNGSGEWERMEQRNSQDDDSKRLKGLALSSDQIIVSWCWFANRWMSELAAYSLSSLSSLTTPSHQTTDLVPQGTTALTGDERLLSPFHYTEDAWVSHILVTSGGKLLTTDKFGDKIRMASLQTPEVTEDTLYLDSAAKGMTELRDGRIALIHYGKEIVILSITDNTLQNSERIETDFFYRTILQGPGDSLIVSRWQEATEVRIDIIAMDGRIQRTVFNDNDIMQKPVDMKHVEDSLYVSDYETSNLLRVDTNTGEAAILLGNQDLHQPGDLDIAEDGTIYLITGGSVCQSDRCIIRLTGTGEWEEMEQYASQSGEGHPTALALISDMIVISWVRFENGFKSEMTSYALSSSSLSTRSLKSPDRVSRRMTAGSGDNQTVFTVSQPIFRYRVDSAAQHILVSRGRKLITAGYRIRMASLDRPEETEDTLDLNDEPKGMTELRDGRIALTFVSFHGIKTVTITNNTLQLSEQIDTKYSYIKIVRGVGDTLIGVKRRDIHAEFGHYNIQDESSIDIIAMDGSVLRTIFRNYEILSGPTDMKRVGNFLFVADYQLTSVFRVNMNTGEATMLLKSRYQRYPKSLDVAEDGSVYLVTFGRMCNYKHCIIRVTGPGEWERIELAFHGSPSALALTSDMIIISMQRGMTGEMTAYTLPLSPRNKRSLQPAEMLPQKTASETGDERQQLVFRAVPQTFHYFEDSWIGHILVTKGGKLITADFDQEEIKVASLERPEVTEDSLYLLANPKGMVELRDGRIALTLKWRREIAIIAITGDKLQTSEEIKTEHYYKTIVQGPGDTLIVGKWRDADTEATIDLIAMDGRVLRTIFHQDDIMHGPSGMERVGDVLFVSDYQTNNLFRVDVNTGEAAVLLGSEVLFHPSDLNVATDGSVYLLTRGIVCQSERCIIRVTGTGEWEGMEQYASQSREGHPTAFALTPDMIVISWAWWEEDFKSEVTSYILPSSPQKIYNLKID